jgi:hypothetical protein
MSEISTGMTKLLLSTDIIGVSCDKALLILLSFLKLSFDKCLRLFAMGKKQKILRKVVLFSHFVLALTAKS